MERRERSRSRDNDGNTSHFTSDRQHHRSEQIGPISDTSIQDQKLRDFIGEINQQLFYQEPQKPKIYDLFASSDSEEETQPVHKAVAFWDEQGYYMPQVDDVINGYTITGISGKGVFASVVRAHKQGNNFAIKILRTTMEVMRMSGEKERGVIQMLNKFDPNDRKHIVRLQDSFEFKGHLCLVFEQLHINLRETLTQFGKGVGLSLEGVCLYAGQIFSALDLVHKLKYIHADLKPDNIMISDNTRSLKICDFGSSIGFNEVDLMKSAQIVSPFYRPPEIILGYYPLDGAVDIWSAGVTLFELYTGKFLFPGTSNNHILSLIMKLKGRVPQKMLKKSEFSQDHFEQNLFINFQKNKKTETVPEFPQEHVINILKQSPQSVSERDMNDFADLIEQCTTIDPSKRITAEQALQHPFVNMLRIKQLLK